MEALMFHEFGHVFGVRGHPCWWPSLLHIPTYGLGLCVKDRPRSNTAAYTDFSDSAFGNDFFAEKFWLNMVLQADLRYLEVYGITGSECGDCVTTPGPELPYNAGQLIGDWNKVLTSTVAEAPWGDTYEGGAAAQYSITKGRIVEGSSEAWILSLKCLYYDAGEVLREVNLWRGTRLLVNGSILGDYTKWDGCMAMTTLTVGRHVPT
jgi:hypothetical protein